MSAFWAKMTEIYFGCDSATDPAGVAYRAPPDLLAGIKVIASYVHCYFQ